MESLRIFIVEDERIVALEMEEYLQRMGFSVCGSAASGEVALAICAAKVPDVVLMDIMIEGGLNGIEAAVRIRQQSGAAVIFCSSTTGEMRRRAEAIAPLGFLEKPLDYGRLAQMLCGLEPAAGGM